MPTFLHRFTLASADRPAFLHALAEELSSAHRRGRIPVVVCIGTDRSTGDALGPLVGSRLRALTAYPYICGTLDDPIHAVNLTQRMDRLHHAFPHGYFIAVDACLGSLSHVGTIRLRRGAVYPGSAMNKTLPPVGDLAVSGIVNVCGYREQAVLGSTRLNLVMKMAERIAEVLAAALPSAASVEAACEKEHADKQKSQPY